MGNPGHRGGRPQRRPSRGDSCPALWGHGRNVASRGVDNRRAQHRYPTASPDGLHVFVTGPGATIVDEFAAIDRQTQLITATTIVVLLILLLIVYRSAITATVPLLSVVVSLAVAKPIVSVLVDRDFIGISLFSSDLALRWLSAREPASRCS